MSKTTLPLFTYEVGNFLPGIVLQVIAQFLFYWIFREWKAVPSACREDGLALLTTIVTLSASAPVLAPLHRMVYESSSSKLYYDFLDHSMYWTIASFCLTCFIIETFFWKAHYLAHKNSWFYTYIHSVHHSFVPSTVNCASAFHPMDVSLLTTASFLCVFLYPVHYAIHSSYLLFSLFWTLFVHTGSRFKFPKFMEMFLNSPSMHCLHHDYGRNGVNLGSLFSFWDHLMQTHRTELVRWSVTRGDD